MRYKLFVHLDAAEHLAVRHGAFDGEEEREDIDSAIALIPDLVELVREIVRVRLRWREFVAVDVAGEPDVTCGTGGVAAEAVQNARRVTHLR